MNDTKETIVSYTHDWILNSNEVEECTRCGLCVSGSKDPMKNFPCDKHTEFSSSGYTDESDKEYVYWICRNEECAHKRPEKPSPTPNETYLNMCWKCSTMMKETDEKV